MSTATTPSGGMIVLNDHFHNQAHTEESIYGDKSPAQALEDYEQTLVAQPRRRRGIIGAILLLAAGAALAVAAISIAALAVGVKVVPDHAPPPAATAPARPATPAPTPAAPAPPAPAASFGADLAAAGISAPAWWETSTGQRICSAWAAGETLAQTDPSLIAGGLQAGHVAPFDSAANRDLCPAQSPQP